MSNRKQKASGKKGSARPEKQDSKKEQSKPAVVKESAKAAVREAQKKAAPPPPPAPEAVKPEKDDTKMKAVVAAVVVIALALAVLVVIFGVSLLTSESGSTVEGEYTPQTESFTQLADTEIELEAADQLEGQWVEITLTTGERYFGRMAEAEALGGYLLWNVWYVLAGEGDSLEFQQVGTEIHQPRPFIVVASSAVRTWQQLASDSEVLREIAASEDFADMPAPQQDEILNAAGHAVFLADGTVLFGVLVKDGTRVGVQDGYYLVRTNPGADVNDPIETLDDLQLVTQRGTTSGLLSTLWIGSDMLVMYQALGDDSRIVTAIQEAR